MGANAVCLLRNRDRVLETGTAISAIGLLRRFRLGGKAESVPLLACVRALFIVYVQDAASGRAGPTPNYNC